MTANEKRQKVANKYREILGRNNYSQAKRDYCYKKYSDGKYYSDCSSSISYAYKEAGYSFGTPNTVGMYNSQKLADVPVEIKDGKITNPEVLRIGDMLLFARTDSSRAASNYVGHVEMVYAINGSKVTLAGHGSGNPRTIDMNTYCAKQFAIKTKTKVGHKGLIRVRRFIQDDVIILDPDVTVKSDKIKITGNTVYIRSGPGTNYPVLDTAKKGAMYTEVKHDGWKTIYLDGTVGWVSDKYSEGIKG